MLHLPEWLIVMGTDRNAGKTTLISEVIRANAGKRGLTAIKISPHFHALTGDENILMLTEQFVITEETNPSSGKDSSRMLAAGAEKVLYVQVWDQNLEKALVELIPFIDNGSPVICESGWIRNLIRPGVFAIVNRKGNTLMKDSIESLRPLADGWFEFDGRSFTPGPWVIELSPDRWKINP